MCADQSSFPLAGLEAVANAQHQWVALAMTPASGAGSWQTLLTLLSYPDVGAALAPLDTIVTLDEPLRLQDEHMAALPAGRVVLRIPRPCWPMRRSASTVRSWWSRAIASFPTANPVCTAPKRACAA
ncbi:hypothetical protein [Pseudoduganella plicata]|uniref:hypothetical protein n=1 Tax=Pseudoduganella plicata TaxID=321984 RepID=UPI001E5AC6B3|nr:hypothetical protein [Pseudoduganella plicata]